MKNYMTDVFLALSIIVAVGSSIRYIFKDIDADLFRKYINKIVLYFILPALIFNVVYNSNAGNEFYQIPLVAGIGIITSLLLAFIVFNFTNLSSKTKGALILASAFSNVTYLGLPVLQGVFPDIPDKIAVVSVLFEVTTSPILLSLGTLFAIYYGSKTKLNGMDILKRILKLPPIWALFVALLFGYFNIPVPKFVLIATKTLSVTASGLMMLSLGIALKYRKPQHLVYIALVCVIQLLFIPFVVYYAGKMLGIAEPFFEASVLEAAMPTQLLTLVIADEFDLDLELLAFIIFITTILSFFTLPLIRFML